MKTSSSVATVRVVPCRVLLWSDVEDWFHKHAGGCLDNARGVHEAGTMCTRPKSSVDLSGKGMTIGQADGALNFLIKKHMFRERSRREKNGAAAYLRDTLHYVLCTSLCFRFDERKFSLFFSLNFRPSTAHTSCKKVDTPSLNTEDLYYSSHRSIARL